MDSSKETINVRILANDFEKKWDLHKGIYALHASREHGLVFKGSRTEATISRQIIRQHGIGKLKGVGANQHFYFIQVGRKSPYGEGTINIFDTPELTKLGKKKGMTGAAYIGEWITHRIYKKTIPGVSDPPPVEEVEESDDSDSSYSETEGASGGGDGPWWEQSMAEAEYEWDIAIPISKQQHTVVVQDTDDVYSVPNKTEKTPPADSSLYYNVDEPSPVLSPSPKPSNKKSTKRKTKTISKVTVEDTQDVYSLPDISPTKK